MIGAIRRLPQSPADGQTTSDPAGNRYRYFTARNEWVSVGGTISSQIVTYQSDGLITPEVAELIQDLRESTYKNFKLQGFRGSYYYLLQGANRLFITTIEDGRLRLEINRNALSNLLLHNACQGNKGIQGPRGDDGLDGRPGPSEVAYVPHMDGDKLTITIPNIPTPLETPISVRLRSGDKFLEIWLSLDNQWQIISGNTSIDESQTTMELVNGEFRATIAAREDWQGDWTIRARQRGPRGLEGRDGESFIKIVESALYALRATNFIISFRKSPSSHNISIVKKSFIGDNVPVARLRPHGGMNIGDACVTSITPLFAEQIETRNKLLAVEPSIDSNKKLRRWEFKDEAQAIGDLSFLSWTPDPSCLKPNEEHWKPDVVVYDWWRAKDYAPEIEKLIKPPSQMPHKCCQEDFYFCPNLGNTPCWVEPKGRWDPAPRWLPL